MQACADAGLEPWHDPHNDDGRFTRVRVRRTVLPMLEDELGPGIADALVRTADQLREDADALDHFAEEIAEDLAEHSEAGISLPVVALAANPPALRQRLIRLAVLERVPRALSRARRPSRSRASSPTGTGSRASTCPALGWSGEGPMLQIQRA